MKTLKKIAVVGSGSWGTGLANVFADAGHQVTIWGRDTETVQAIQTKHENPKYLKGIPLNPNLKSSSDLHQTVNEADWVVCAIPTQQIRSVFKPLSALLDKKWIINTSKGIEVGSLLRVSEIFREIAPQSSYSILSGPSFALEVAKRLPTAVTLASSTLEIATEIQMASATPYFRSYTSRDVTGVEFAGSLKNVVAIASGMVSGLNLGFNAQAALINRGIAEIMRIAKAFHADPFTFLGLAGTGDLILTCTGPLSRNRKVGVLIGEGKKLDTIQKDLGGIAEGVYTAKSAHELAQKAGIELPITEQIYEILYEGKMPKQALESLMGRELKEEW
jgi:glycerol-3-phosphate dehydrogenase (NAD(P)+)